MGARPGARPMQPDRRPASHPTPQAGDGLARRCGSLVAGPLALLTALALAVPSRSSGALAPALKQLLRDELAAGLGRENAIRILRIRYVAHDGLTRRAYVILPRWYRPGADPPIPLVISPHGRGVPALGNVRLWGNLPALGRFAVVCPEGQGRRLRLYAWGDPGDVADLARMPGIVERALPYLHILARRIYAFGSSMGGQETLLLVARAPHLLAGAAAFDSDTNLADRYRLIIGIPYGRSLRRKLVEEVGGTPSSVPSAYRARSPLFHAREIAFSGVPLQIWWSRKDRVIRDQNAQSGRLYRVIRRLDPRADVVQVVGSWTHSAEFGAARRLTLALSAFSLLPVRARASLDPAAKLALGLPQDWVGPPLAVDWNALATGSAAQMRAPATRRPHPASVR
jgi:hypothetical protein